MPGMVLLSRRISTVDPEIISLAAVGLFTTGLPTNGNSRGRIIREDIIHWKVNSRKVK